MKYPLNTHGIPTTLSRETVGVAAGVATLGDVIEGMWVGVEEGVQESERGLALSDQPVVDEGDDTGEDGGGATRPCDQKQCLILYHHHVVANSSDVREGSSCTVKQSRVGVAEGGEVGLDSRKLVSGPGEDVGEPARRERGGGLRQTGSCADGGYTGMRVR